MAAPAKRVYGLVLPKALAAPAKAPLVQRAVFDDSDDNGLFDTDALHRAQSVRATQAAAAAQEAAAASDVFDYDAWKEGADESAARDLEMRKAARVRGAPRESRYISNLLLKAEERKRERDVIYDRMQAKELAAEESAAGTSEKFITPAYAAVLEERAAAEAAEAARAAHEVHVGITGSMTDFYAKLMTKNVSYGAHDMTVASVAGKRPRNEVEENVSATAAPSAVPSTPSVGVAHVISLQKGSSDSKLRSFVAAAPATAPGSVSASMSAHPPPPQPPFEEIDAASRVKRPTPVLEVSAVTDTLEPGFAAPKAVSSKLSVDAVAAAKLAALARLQARQQRG